MTTPAPAPQKKASSRSKRVNVEVPEMVTEIPSGGLPGEKVQPIMYLRGRLLGKGGFAAVYELQNMSDGLVVAGKVISKETLQKARARAKLETEIAIHRRLQHPNVVKFLRSFEDNTNVYILLECCTGRTLADLLRSKTRLTDAEAADLLLQTITAIKMLHDQRIIHRDLKLSNLFLDKAGKVKVGDFGLACQLSYDGERKTTICGTPNYIAPEVLAGKSGHSYEVDVWSLGVILYTLLIGKPPFETSDVRSTYRRIRSNAYFFPEGIPISDEGADLIRKVLKTEPEQRPTIHDMLEHPFFTRFSAPPPSKLYASPTPVQPTATPKATAGVKAGQDSSSEAQVVHVNVWAGAPPVATKKSAPPPALQVPSNMPSTPEAWARYWGGNTPTAADVSKTPSSATTSSQQQQQYKPPERQTSSGGGGPLVRQDSSPGGLGDSNIDTMSNCPLSPSSYMSLSRGGSGLVGGMGSGTFNADLLSSGGKLRSRYTANSPTAAATPPARRTASLTHGARPEWQLPSSSDTTGLQRSDSASSAKWQPSQGNGGSGDVATLTGQLRAQQLDDRRRGGVSNNSDPMDVEYPSTPVGARPPQPSAKPPPTPLYTTTNLDDKEGAQQQTQTVAVSVRCDAATLASLEGLGFQMPSNGSPARKVSPAEEGGAVRRPPLPSPVPRQGDATPLWHQPDTANLLMKTNPTQWGSPQRDSASPKISAMPASPPISTQLNWDAVLTTSPASVDPSPIAIRGQKHSAGFLASEVSAAAPLSSSPAAHRPSVWVTKWVDYSSKYGMGYVLSNGAVGVLFNDATKVLLLPDRSRYIYLEKSKGGQGGRSVREERMVLRSDEEPPASLKKKATLLWYFEGYLKGANFRVRSNKHPGRVSGECVGPGPVDESGADEVGVAEDSTYVKKWLKTRHAIIFRLSNKVIQVDFNDETEIVLSSEMQSVTYVNKSRESTTHWLSQLPQDVELLKRLKYTKDILLQLIGGSGSGNSSGSSASAAVPPTTMAPPSGVTLHN